MAWQDELDSAYAQYKDRGKFTYDPQTDAGYKQYEQAYLKMGRQAMKDTVGQASALTGGYGNSYAATAGAQQYMNFAGQAAQAIPQFQNMAMQQYQMEGDRLVNQYNMAASGRDFDYRKERDAVADSQWQQQFDYQKSRDAVSDQHWQREFDATYDRWKQEFLYQQGRDKVSDQHWQKEYDATYDRWAKEFARQQQRDAVSDSQWQQSFGYQQTRDAASDAQWQKTFDYQQSRDAVSDSHWQQTFDYQKQQDAADRAYKYAALNKSSGGSGSGGTKSSKTGTASASDPYKGAKYADYLNAYVQLAETDERDAGEMLRTWKAEHRITDKEAQQIRSYFVDTHYGPRKS